MEVLEQATSGQVVLLRHSRHWLRQRRPLCDGSASHLAGVDDPTAVDVFRVLARHVAAVARDGWHPILPHDLRFGLAQRMGIRSWIGEALLRMGQGAALPCSKGCLQSGFPLVHLPLLLPRAVAHGSLRTPIDVLCLRRWDKSGVPRHERIHALVTHGLPHALELVLWNFLRCFGRSPSLVLRGPVFGRIQRGDARWLPGL
mmetsp:Transcript_82996/g.199143  ORF Transcript_82996/g.199143 Transcript_82996/m.199143 type:complete len:201 (-) Transcript_82996:50-652(-)